MSAHPLLLGLLGLAWSGKTTAANYLEREFSMDTFAIADPLFNASAAIAADAGVDGVWLTERTLKEQPMPVLGVSYRELAQRLGDALRAIDPDFLLRIAGARLKQARLSGSEVVITDLRYPREAEWIRQQGGVVVRLRRGGLPQVREHSSEAHVETMCADHEVDNSGSMLLLQDRLDDLVHELRAQRGALTA